VPSLCYGQWDMCRFNIINLILTFFFRLFYNGSHFAYFTIVIIISVGLAIPSMVYFLNDRVPTDTTMF